MGNKSARQDRAPSPTQRYAVSTSDVRLFDDSCRVADIEKAKNLEEIKTLKAELDALKAELDAVREELLFVKVEHEKQKHELHTYEEDNAKLKNELEGISEHQEKLNMTIHDLQQSLEKTRDEMKLLNTEKETLTKQLSVIQEDNHHGTDSREQNADAKPNTGASYLVNLSDENRPDKIAERFTELYNDEWTDCIEVLSSEEGMCQILLGICLNIYSTYVEAIESDSNKTNAFVTVDMELDDDLKAFLKVLRGGKVADSINLYWTKCKDICKSMIAHDPPIYLDSITDKHGETFDVTLYQGYTKRGIVIDFIVWPALYLYYNGTMLCKGVAQGIA